MTTQTYTGTLEVVLCASSGMQFGLPEGFAEERRRDHASFYCPLGHRHSWSQESDVEEARRREKEALARAERESTRAQAARDQADAEARSHRATRGHLTRQRKRAAHGVCPCCQRTFADVARHMAGQHPDYVKAAG